MEDHEREVARLVGLLEGERREKEEEAQVFHKKVNMALTHDHDYLLAGGMTIASFTLGARAAATVCRGGGGGQVEGGEG